DIPLLIKVVLSTAPLGRAIIFDLLLQHKGKLVSSDIRASLQFSRPTVLRAMTELMVLRLVDGEQEGDYDNSPRSIELKREFRWCLTRQFKQLREGFSPMQKSRKRASSDKRSPNQGDNVEEGSTERKEKSVVVNQFTLFPSYFWTFFDQLLFLGSIEQEDGAISESRLKQLLISNTEITAGEAEQLIKDALTTGRVQRIGYDRIKKTKRAEDKQFNELLENNSQSEVSKNDSK
nr:hypothetical protein [Thermoproteota archaeon]